MQLKSLTLAVLMAALAAPALADEVLQQAEQLLRQQKPADAVQLLAPLEETRAGDPDYDYLLGQALLESGDAGNAVFAFERCLASQPENGPCRVQMARTHLAMGETANARAELETIEAYNPPPQVKEMVSQFLGAVSTREKQEKRQLNAYAQLGAGFDSNVNSATNASTIAIPALGGVIFTIPTSARARDSGFANLQAGGSFQYRNTPKTTTFGDLGLTSRSYTDENDFSYLTLDGSLGLNHRLATGSVNGKLNMQTMWLDGDAYRNVLGLGGQYQYDLGLTGQLAFFLQWNRLRYDSQPTRDSDKTTGGVAWSQALDGDSSPVVFASLYAAQENMKESSAPAKQFGNNAVGLRGGGSLSLSKTVRINGSLSYESRNYDGVFTGQAVARDENQTDLSLGLAWRIRPALTLQPGYTYTKNSSNIVLFDTERHIVGVDLRYDM